MKKRFLAALSAVCLMCLSTLPAFAAETDRTGAGETDTFKIASINMLTTSHCAIVYEYKGETYDRGQMVQDFLKSEGIDSAGLNECGVKWNAYLDTVFGEDKDYAIAGRTSCGGDVLTGGGTEYVPILYRTDKYELVEDGGWWLSETPDVKSKITILGRESMKYERGLAYAVLKSKETGEIAYIHMNTHMDHKSDDKINVTCAQVITSKAAYLKERFGDVPFVLTGDFNCNEETKAYKYLADPENGFVDSKYLTEDRDMVPTYVGHLDDYMPEAHPKKIIDFVFASNGNVETVRARVINDKYFSDHSIVVSEVKFNDNGSSIGPYVDTSAETGTKNEEATASSASASGSTASASQTSAATVSQNAVDASASSESQSSTGNGAQTKESTEIAPAKNSSGIVAVGIGAGCLVLIGVVFLAVKKRK